MNSVRVNLLPKDLFEQARARRVARGSYVGLAVFVLALAGVYGHGWNQVRLAEEEREAAQAEVSQLQAELAELEEYRELAERLDARNQTLATAMSDEISWARILNDLALTFPSDSSLLSLDTMANDVEEPEEGEIDPGHSVGEMTVTGYSIEEYAPGVESVLIDFESARGFFNSYLQTATADERADSEITTFSGTIDLDDDARTGRYTDGLPAEVTE
ncbi:hypothetical protein ER308_19410 [Egibacter rhizosphaerae]|uniref:Fimbrial assembly protein n=1 Tax=Egibacter rhizosphaerae TaxID=1670831 RepID=A0A411YK09_9ACTN|nr:hypothetical protein [Egibacter rhizosphaerae]QBI21523.1 hypothetical protein ER308_19410 [Egibacter rhizosphaerae]